MNKQLIALAIAPLALISLASPVAADPKPEEKTEKPADPPAAPVVPVTPDEGTPTTPDVPKSVPWIIWAKFGVTTEDSDYTLTLPVPNLELLDFYDPAGDFGDNPGGEDRR